MKTPLCQRLGCELPIFAFSHCRDVVVAVTRAGGFGVLGASTFSPQQLEAELRWIDKHVEGRPYGVDVIIPTRYDQASEDSTEDLRALIPQGHRDFMENLLSQAGVAALPAGEKERIEQEIVDGRGNMTPDGARRLLAVALTHSQVNFVVSALGSPPPDVVAELRDRGILIGALCGKAEHAVRHIAAGVDVIVAQGTEAGGHTGEIATMVLVPQVVEACGDGVAVLAAGGIARGSQIAAAMALGAQVCGAALCGWAHARASSTHLKKGCSLEPARTMPSDARLARAKLCACSKVSCLRLGSSQAHPLTYPHLCRVFSTTKHTHA